MLTVAFKKKNLLVADFAAASSAYSAARDKSGQGMRSWKDGTIHDATGVQIARLSYNGKVWPVAEWYPDMKPLYDPYAA